MQAKRVSRQVRRLQGGCTKRCVNEWKGVYPNPERKITTFSESRFGSRFGIPHYSSEFVGKIRISPCRPSSASAHAARSLLSCALWRGMGRLWRGMGGRRPPLRNTACWVFASHESRITRHESRLFFESRLVIRLDALPTSAHYCPLLPGIARQKNIVPASVRAPSGVLVGPHGWPACLTTRRGEVGERAVRTRRKPGGGKRREPLGARRRT